MKEKILLTIGLVIGIIFSLSLVLANLDLDGYEKINLDSNLENSENCEIIGSGVDCGLEGGVKVMLTEEESKKRILIQNFSAHLDDDLELYQKDGRLYLYTEDDEVKSINIYPLEAKIMALMSVEGSSEIEDSEMLYEGREVEINSEGNYEVEVEKTTYFLGLFEIEENIEVEVDSTTGAIIRQDTPWWTFLTTEKDEDNESNDFDDNPNTNGNGFFDGSETNNFSENESDESSPTIKSNSNTTANVNVTMETEGEAGIPLY